MRNIGDFGKKLLCRAIYALLDDGTIQARIVEANRHVILLKFFSDEFPREIWDDFSSIINDLKKNFGEEGQSIPPTCNLTAEQEVMLTERLLSIYVKINGGNLII